MKNKFAIALSFYLLSNAACTSDEEDALVGMWYSLDSVGANRNELDVCG